MKFEIKNADFIRDGKPIKLISGAVHYFRNFPDTWEDIFLKLKAIGCNCVETYCPWNLHEKQPQVYDFSGLLDLKAFIELAKKHELMMIVRPGPYICSEWDFGGLPWWLQNDESVVIRSSSPSYLKYVDRYFDKLFEIITPNLATNGGPIIMLQAENEYGYYGDDKKYLNYIKEAFISRGVDVPIFTADGIGENDLLDGTIDGCLATLNFGSDVKRAFESHDKLFPNMPKMCMEMWTGWFDAWGNEKHITTSAEKYAKTVDDMLKIGSMNMFMFIGGTSFGFMTGANYYGKYAPDVTSYDWDGPLSECGDITPKYHALREVIKKYVDYELPKIPENRKKKAYGKIRLDKSCGIFDNLDKISSPIYSLIPENMEKYGQGYGYIAYQTKLEREYKDAELKIEELYDRAQIYINSTLVDILYINDKNNTKFNAEKGDTLTILCENMGRANFSAHMNRKKGIVGRCMINSKLHYHWNVYTLPMDNLDKLDFSKEPSEKSAFYKGSFNLDEACDTFVKLDSFSKGFVTINGFNLGRYWEIGPQRALYVPKGVLKQGENEIVVFDSDGIKTEPCVEFIDHMMLG